MALKNVCIIGGSGFVGRHVAERLSAAGVDVRIPTRNRELAKDSLILLPTAEVVVADIHDPADLRRVIGGCDAVINLVGVLHDRRGNGFQRNHAELPALVVAACREAGIPRLLHMSALGASESGPSDYLRSKAAGEVRIRETRRHGIATTIFRPSVIFGPGDRFLNLFATLARWFPLLPVGGAAARFQPIFVEDVARAMVDSLENRATFDHDYDLCGPTVYTLKELIEFACGQLGLSRTIVPLPGGLASLQAGVLEKLPGRLLTRDNLKSMSVDNVCGCAFPSEFGFLPQALEAVAPRYLGARSIRMRYDTFRGLARR
ncbi:MAG: complex I NDUFA9 subunit family protein [Burkholderiales bacterium]